MSWEAVGAIGETIGAIAVVISLLYLALQIRTQNAQARLSALHDMSDVFREVTSRFASADIADIFNRGNLDFDSLTDTESVRLIILTTNYFRAWEEAFLEKRDGHLDKGTWETLSRDYRQAMGAGSFKRIWELRKENYDVEFQDFVGNLNTHPYVIR